MYILSNHNESSVVRLLNMPNNGAFICFSFMFYVTNWVWWDIDSKLGNYFWIPTYLLSVLHKIILAIKLDTDIIVVR